MWESTAEVQVVMSVRPAANTFSPHEISIVTAKEHISEVTKSRGYSTRELACELLAQTEP